MNRPLGPECDTRAFHVEVLRHGAMPLGILEHVVDARARRGVSRR